MSHHAHAWGNHIAHVGRMSVGTPKKAPKHALKQAPEGRWWCASGLPGCEEQSTKWNPTSPHIRGLHMRAQHFKHAQPKTANLNQILDSIWFNRRVTRGYLHFWCDIIVLQEVSDRNLGNENI